MGEKWLGCTLCTVILGDVDYPKIGQRGSGIQILVFSYFDSDEMRRAKILHKFLIIVCQWQKINKKCSTPLCTYLFLFDLHSLVMVGKKHHLLSFYFEIVFFILVRTRDFFMCMKLNFT